MDDRGHNRDGPRRWGTAVPLSRRAGTPSNTGYIVAWAEFYFRTKWRLHPSSRLATIYMNRKLGAVALLWGSCEPIQHNVALAEVYPHTKWHLDLSSRSATIYISQKIGWGGCALFFWGSWVPIEHKVAWTETYLHTKWHFSPSNHLATTDIGRTLGGLKHYRVGRDLPQYQVAS